MRSPSGVVRGRFSKKVTFIDSGVLIAAVRGNAEVAFRALEILDDPERSFASSIFVQLELLPKASYYGYPEEMIFYEAFFKEVRHWADPGPLLAEGALDVAIHHGLSAVDALHAAAALSVNASELVTSEKRSKPIHRLTGITVRTIHPD